MQIDPANPVVALCAEGMQAESRQQLERARELFQRAWTEHRSDYEAAIAAHFLARHQPSLDDSLRWNQRALEHALAAPADQVDGFFASLYLNLAHAYEMLERTDQAQFYLARGEAALGALPDSPYAAVVRDGLSRMRLRLGGPARG